MIEEKLGGWDMVPIQVHCADKTVVLIEIPCHASLVPLASLELVNVTLDPALVVHGQLLAVTLQPRSQLAPHRHARGHTAPAFFKQLM